MVLQPLRHGDVQTLWTFDGDGAMTNGGGPGHGIKARQKSAAKKNKRRVAAATAKRKG